MIIDTSTAFLILINVCNADISFDLFNPQLPTYSFFTHLSINHLTCSIQHSKWSICGRIVQVLFPSFGVCIHLYSSILPEKFSHLNICCKADGLIRFPIFWSFPKSIHNFKFCYFIRPPLYLIFIWFINSFLLHWHVIYFINSLFLPNFDQCLCYYIYLIYQDTYLRSPYQLSNHTILLHQKISNLQSCSTNAGLTKSDPIQIQILLLPKLVL